jgi:D-alanyl-D-alanine carboxypeptidase
MRSGKTLKVTLLVLITSLIGLGLFGFLQLRSSGQNGEVLGESTNYYKEKTVSLVSPPKRKPGSPDPQVYADSAILVYDNGKYPLYEKNSHKAVSVASITKLMTALVSRDLYLPDDIIEVVESNTQIDGSVIGLKAGEKITYESVLRGMLMNSGNDAAAVLSASEISKDEFVQKMNEKAAEFGLKDTHFLDPAGLNDQGRSSAYDISIIFSIALKDDLISKIISTSEAEVASTDGSLVHKLKNSNRLITGEIPLEGAIGGKTGFTYEAGHTLVAGSKIQDRVLISVILKTYSNTNTASAEEAKKLLQWGSESYTF